MQKVVPVLPIDDGDAAKAFYVDKLGFELDFAWRHEPGFPIYMGVKSGDLYLHLSEHAKGQDAAEVYLFVDDIADWHERCKEKRVAIESGPQKMPWGNTDMLIHDPYRNTLRFSQIGTHDPTASSA